MDYIWGTGIPINDPDPLCSDRWANQGILGEVLQELRDDYIEYEESLRSNPGTEVPKTNDPGGAENNMEI